jgi:hypothetical protein
MLVTFYQAIQRHHSLENSNILTQRFWIKHMLSLKNIFWLSTKSWKILSRSLLFFIPEPSGPGIFQTLTKHERRSLSTSYSVVGYTVRFSCLDNCSIMDLTPIQVIELYLLGYNAVYTALLATCFHSGFLFDLLFDPEDGRDTFLWNAGWLSTDYKVQGAIPQRIELLLTTAVRVSGPTIHLIALILLSFAPWQ